MSDSSDTCDLKMYGFAQLVHDHDPVDLATTKWLRQRAGAIDQALRGWISQGWYGDAWIRDQGHRLDSIKDVMEYRVTIYPRRPVKEGERLYEGNWSVIHVDKEGARRLNETP